MSEVHAAAATGASSTKSREARFMLRTPPAWKRPPPPGESPGATMRLVVAGAEVDSDGWAPIR